MPVTSEVVGVAREVNDVWSVLVEAVEQVHRCRRWQVLDRDQVAVLRVLHPFLYLTYLVVDAKPDSLSLSGAIGKGGGRLDRFGIGGQVQHT